MAEAVLIGMGTAFLLSGFFTGSEDHLSYAVMCLCAFWICRHMTKLLRRDDNG